MSLPFSSRRARAALVAAVFCTAACAGDDAEPVMPSSTRPPTSSTSLTPTTAAVDPFTLTPPEPVGDPASLAGRITEAERVLHDPAAAEPDVAAAALAHQAAYRQLGDRPDWDAAVHSALPEGLRATVERHVEARRELRTLSGSPRTSLPAWQIVAPPALDDLRRSYEEAAAAFGLEWPYLASINLVETGFGRIRGTSEAGAQGPMQFLPATWEAYGAGGDIDDPRDAIFGAARLLAANGGATDMAGALFRYNHSDRYVRAVTHYAGLIAADPPTLRALYFWGVYYRTVRGDIHLPVGYHETASVPLS